jgi:hypothetical protein
MQNEVSHRSYLIQESRWRISMSVFLGRGYFAGLRVTKRKKATVLLTVALFQTPTLIPTLILTLTLT